MTRWTSSRCGVGVTTTTYHGELGLAMGSALMLPLAMHIGCRNAGCEPVVWTMKRSVSSYYVHRRCVHRRRDHRRRDLHPLQRQQWVMQE